MNFFLFSAIKLLKLLQALLLYNLHASSQHPVLEVVLVVESSDEREMCQGISPKIYPGGGNRQYLDRWSGFKVHSLGLSLLALPLCAICRRDLSYLPDSTCYFNVCIQKLYSLTPFKQGPIPSSCAFLNTSSLASLSSSSECCSYLVPSFVTPLALRGVSVMGFILRVPDCFWAQLQQY